MFLSLTDSSPHRQAVDLDAPRAAIHLAGEVLSSVRQVARGGLLAREMRVQSYRVALDYPHLDTDTYGLRSEVGDPVEDLLFGLLVIPRPLDLQRVQILRFVVAFSPAGCRFYPPDPRCKRRLVRNIQPSDGMGYAHIPSPRNAKTI